MTKKGSPTIHKRRYVDQYTQNKLLELYVMDDTPLQEHEELNEKIGDEIMLKDMDALEYNFEDYLLRKTIPAVVRTSVSRLNIHQTSCRIPIDQRWIGGIDILLFEDIARKV